MSTVPIRRSPRLAVLVWLVLPVMAIVGVLSAIELGPSMRAAQGHGTAGTFTVLQKSCNRGCNFRGDWVSADRQHTRTNMVLYGASDSLDVGDSAPALDTGAREGVYANPGSFGPLVLDALLTLAGTAAGVGWVVFLTRAWRKRFGSKQTQHGPITYR